MGRSAEKHHLQTPCHQQPVTRNVPAALGSRLETGRQVDLSSPLPPVLFLLYSLPFSSLGDKRKIGNDNKLHCQRSIYCSFPWTNEMPDEVENLKV